MLSPSQVEHALLLVAIKATTNWKQIYPQYQSFSLDLTYAKLLITYITQCIIHIGLDIQDHYNYKRQPVKFNFRFLPPLQSITNALSSPRRRMRRTCYQNKTRTSANQMLPSRWSRWAMMYRFWRGKDELTMRKQVPGATIVNQSLELYLHRYDHTSMRGTTTTMQYFTTQSGATLLRVGSTLKRSETHGPGWMTGGRVGMRKKWVIDKLTLNYLWFLIFHSLFLSFTHQPTTLTWEK